MRLQLCKVSQPRLGAAQCGGDDRGMKRDRRDRTPARGQNPAKGTKPSEGGRMWPKGQKEGQSLAKGTEPGQEDKTPSKRTTQPLCRLVF